MVQKTKRQIPPQITKRARTSPNQTPQKQRLQTTLTIQTKERSKNTPRNKKEETLFTQKERTTLTNKTEKRGVPCAVIISFYSDISRGKKVRTTKDIGLFVGCDF